MMLSIVDEFECIVLYMDINWEQTRVKNKLIVESMHDFVTLDAV